MLMLVWGMALHSAASAITPVLPGSPVDRVIQPAQKTWHWTAVPANANHLPWPQAFAFKQIFGRSIDNEPQYARWLSLQPADASWMPSFYSTTDNTLVSLAASARVMCNGTYVDSVVDAYHVFETGLMIRVAFLWKLRKDLPTRSIITYGSIDEQGQWMVQPVECLADTPKAALQPIVLSAPPTSSEVELVSDFGRPGLRNIRTGLWVTPRPSKDPVLASWQAFLRSSSLPVKEMPFSFGVIDIKGQMVVPFLFGPIADAGRGSIVRLCLEHEYKQRCTSHKLPKPTGHAKPPQPKKGSNGLWGYMGVDGQWVVAPQFERARKFVNGYAVAQGQLPKGWQPSEPSGTEPFIHSIKRRGHVWVITAMGGKLPDSTQPFGYSGVINNQGRWLLPFVDDQ